MSAVFDLRAAFALYALLGAAPTQGNPEDASPLGGEAATVAVEGLHAFGRPLPSLDAEQRRAFSVGNAFFRDNWVTAPASAAGRDGLGPLFNARSCGGCHLRDGRGRPPGAVDEEGEGFLLRIGVAVDGGAAPDSPHPVYGGQIQDRATGDNPAEGAVQITTESRPGTYADGAPFELVAPRYSIEAPAYGALGADVRLGPRVAPQLVGLGLIEAIPAEAILARADPNDADGDGISGRAHVVRDARTGERALGRFGWKATVPSLTEQTASAFAHDMGLTTSLFPAEIPTATQARELEFTSGGEPEVDDHKLGRVAFYVRALAVPAQRNPNDARVRAGAVHFVTLGCAACHVPEQRTGTEAAIPALADQRFRPYTDLLLHDLGPALADEKRDGDALPSEWRTPPLWGIGLFEAASGHTRYLHDGRARDLAEAILWHGGEAEPARERFRSLPRAGREELLAFLRSL